MNKKIKVTKSVLKEIFQYAHQDLLSKPALKDLDGQQTQAYYLILGLERVLRKNEIDIFDLTELNPQIKVK